MKNENSEAKRTPILDVRDLSVYYGPAKKRFTAVEDVTFEIVEGESLGLVGESGSGKSTIAKSILGLTENTSGSIIYEDSNLLELSQREFRKFRVDLQMIYQDPIAALNPRLTVRELVAEGLKIWPSKILNGSISEQVDETIESVGLNPKEFGDRRPSELSGGQCQRVAIARALILTPKLLVCDESVSALDVSVQAQVLNLLRKLRKQFGLTMLFISHDLSVVKNICDRVIVLYRGSVCEIGTSDDVFNKAAHPYTQLLVESIPGMKLNPGEERTGCGASIDSSAGCKFSSRCPFATEKCAKEAPPLKELASGQVVACHFAEQTAKSFLSRKVTTDTA